MIKAPPLPEKQAIDMDSDEEVDQALGSAVRETLREHKRLGQSVVVWQEGRVVTLAPEDIPVEVTQQAP